MLIFSSSTRTLSILQALCQSKGYSFVRLDGHTAIDKRLKLCDEFNSLSGQVFLFLISTKAGGTGLNLTSANKVRVRVGLGSVRLWAKAGGTVLNLTSANKVIRIFEFYLLAL